MKPTIAASESGSAEADPLGHPVPSNGSTPPKLPPRSPWRVQSRSVLASVAAMRQPVTNLWRIHPAVQRADAVSLGNVERDKSRVNQIDISPSLVRGIAEAVLLPLGNEGQAPGSRLRRRPDLTDRRPEAIARVVLATSPRLFRRSWPPRSQRQSHRNFYLLIFNRCF